MDVPKLHILNNGSHCDKSYLSLLLKMTVSSSFHSDGDILNLFKAKLVLIPLRFLLLHRFSSKVFNYNNIGMKTRRGGVEDTIPKAKVKAKDTKKIQGQGQPFRGQTLSRPRTVMLEAKA